MNSKKNIEEFSKLPAHVAVIMDGNGRWAKKRLLNRVKGHEQGAETVRMVVRTCRELGIPWLTLYAFSTENWQRPKSEVFALMKLLKKFLESEFREMAEQNIRLNSIGQIEKLPEDVRDTLKRTISETKNNSGLHLNLALSYGSRCEIVESVKKIAKKIANKTISVDSISEKTVSEHLYTASIPDPELIIRTSGEFRISNFLLWQAAYAELYFTDTLWPDFSEQEFLAILKNFEKRERRFGKVDIKKYSGT